MSESENNKEFSLSEGSLLEKEKVLGSNPAPSTTICENKPNFKEFTSTHLLPLLPFTSKCSKVQMSSTVLKEYEEFLRINMRLEPIIVKISIEVIMRFLKFANNTASYETIKGYLATYINKKPKTYNSQITELRRFVRDYLGHENLIKSFKMAPIDEIEQPLDLPNKKQLKEGFETQRDNRAKAIYLFTAKSGLRKCEILALEKQSINFELRLVIPNHFTRKKRSGITFYDSECEEWLHKYLKSRTDTDPRLFLISDRKWREIWRLASKSSQTKITPKILRRWFSTEMGEQLIPDRFIDIFQGRAPRSVLAKHYTGKELLRLKRIYEKANLKVLV